MLGLTSRAVSDEFCNLFSGNPSRSSCANVLGHSSIFLSILGNPSRMFVCAVLGSDAPGIPIVELLQLFSAIHHDLLVAIFRQSFTMLLLEFSRQSFTMLWLPFSRQSFTMFLLPIFSSQSITIYLLHFSRTIHHDASCTNFLGNFHHDALVCQICSALTLPGLLGVFSSIRGCTRMLLVSSTMD